MSELTITQYNRMALQELKQSCGLEAIASVLKTPEDYISGRKKLSGKEINAIRTKASELRQKIEEKARRDYKETLKERLALPEQTIENSLEALFHKGGGRLWKIGEEVPFMGETFVVSHVIRNTVGLKIAIFVPKDKNSKYPPIVACNGTGNLNNVIDDLGKSIGYRSIKHSREEIDEALDEVVKEYGPVRIGGHSLGGAIAQTLTAIYCNSTRNGQSYIAECHYYNSPGIGKMFLELYQSNKQKLAGKPPSIYSYRNVNDLVPHFGAGHLTPNHSIVISDPRFNFKKLIETHRIMGFFRDKILSVSIIFKDSPASPLFESVRRIGMAVIKPILKKFFGNDRVQKRINFLNLYFKNNI